MLKCLSLNKAWGMGHGAWGKNKGLKLKDRES